LPSIRSALIDYLQGDDTPAAAAAAPVLTEILSDPKLGKDVTALIR
jgi:hypothetical protein